MRIIFIRHGATKGNLEGRYIGCRTDEPLCPEGIAAIREKQYPSCEVLVSSPMRRCIETAELLYPGQEMNIYPFYRECDFGDFEGKNYRELSGNSDYQKWLDSGGTMAFPNGESPTHFRLRCVQGLVVVTNAHVRAESIACVVHGGTIMAIMSRYVGGNFYDFQLPNGGAFATEIEDGHMIRWEKL